MYVQPLCRSVPTEADQLLRKYSRFPPIAGPPRPLAARRLPARACPPDEKIRDSDSARAGRIDTRPPAGLPAARPPARAHVACRDTRRLKLMA